MLKANWYQKITQHNVLAGEKYNGIPCFTHWILLFPKFEEFKPNFTQFVNGIFINFSLGFKRMSLNIPDNKEEDFDESINFFFFFLMHLYIKKTFY